MGKKRKLEDIELWRQVAKTVEPLRPLTRVPLAPPPQKDVQNPFDPRKMPVPAQDKAPVAQPALTAPPKPTVFDQKYIRKIKRGKRSPERTLDLHGHSLAAAHPALLGFLHGAQRAHCRLVLVITGKGSTAHQGGERGALRRALPLWMSTHEFRAVVHSFHTATPRLGGDGAYLIHLKKPLFQRDIPAH